MNGGYAHGVQLLLQGMLQSSRFLYRVELGTATAVGANAVKLSGYELATRLSYGLWNTTPDDTLMAAAAGGTLATSADVVAQLQRMLKDQRGATMVPHFLSSWIHLPDLDNVAKNGRSTPSGTMTCATPCARRRRPSSTTSSPTRAARSRRCSRRRPSS